MNKKEIFIILGIIIICGISLCLLLVDSQNGIDSGKNNVIENSNKDENDGSNYDSDIDSSLNVDDKDLSKEEIVNINSKMYDNYYIFADLLEFKTNSIEMNKEYLTISKKIKLAWLLSANDDSLIKKFNIDEKGEESTGSLAIKKSDFLKKYSQLYNETIDEQDITNNYNLTLANDFYYGTYTTGYGDMEFLLKLTNYKIENGNFYTLTFDFLTQFVEKNSTYGKYKDFDYDILNKYSSADVLEYPEELVYSKMKISFIKNNNDYVLKSILFEK